VNQPVNIDQIVEILLATSTSEAPWEVRKFLRDIRDPRATPTQVLDALPDVLMRLSDSTDSDHPLQVVYKNAIATLSSVPSVTAEGATKPTLLEQYARLPCGQQLAVLAVILLFFLSFDLPPGIRDYIAGQLAIIGAALAVIHKITKS
jgi:hypothetical protein